MWRHLRCYHARMSSWLLHNARARMGGLALGLWLWAGCVLAHGLPSTEEFLGSDGRLRLTLHQRYEVMGRTVRPGVYTLSGLQSTQERDNALLFEGLAPKTKLLRFVTGVWAL